MVMNSSPALTAETLATLDAAANALKTNPGPRPNGKAVTAALLAAEKITKHERIQYPPSALYGTWQLCFTAPKKPNYQAGQPVGNGFYMPGLAIAQIRFSPDDSPTGELRIRNQLRVGPLAITFTGPARYLGKKNLLAFDFTHLEVTLFGQTLFQGAAPGRKAGAPPFDQTPIAKLPFFAFFLATEDYVAARGRSGGLAIWVRSQAD